MHFSSLRLLWLLHNLLHYSCRYKLCVEKSRGIFIIYCPMSIRTHIHTMYVPIGKYLKKKTKSRSDQKKRQKKIILFSRCLYQ